MIDNKTYRILVEELNYNNYLYYIKNQSNLTDYEYDLKYKQIQDYELNNPNNILEFSPTQYVEKLDVENNFNNIIHKNKLLSLENTYNIDDLYHFENSIRKDLNITELDELKYIVEPKIDGLSVSINYINGILNFGATRGNGEIGEDVTLNIKTILSLPLILSEPVNITVRGEVFMPKSEFIKLNNENTQKQFANPRNAASGSLRNKNPLITSSRKLDILIFDILDDTKNNFNSRYKMIEYLKKLGFNTIEPKLFNNINETFNYISDIELVRNNFDYEIDGMVIKVDSIKYENLLGNRLKSPKSAVAYKFKPTGVKTKLLEIQANVGRTGVITPRAKFEPVKILGSIVEYATLHNQDYIDELDIRINDTIIVEKAADVIPKVVNVIKSERNGSEIIYKLPKYCPACNFETKKLDGEVAIKCINPNCKAKDIQSIIYFASKNAMNIDGLGQKVIEKLVENNLIEDFTDIYILENLKHKIIELENFGEKKVNNLINAINKSKKNSLENLISGLGINLVGNKAAKILAKKFISIDNLISKNLNDFIEIEGIGEKIGNSLIEYFSDAKNIENIEKLKIFGVNTKYIENLETSTKTLENLTIVLTGKLEEYSRDELSNILETNGAKVVNAISKKVNLVIAGENAGSKLKKAEELNIKIISENEIKKMLNI